MLETLALSATIILIGLAIFQCLLVLGYPLGEYAWGGQSKVLNRNLKIGSVVTILVYAFMITLFLDKAGILNLYDGTPIRDVGYWLMVGFFGIGVVVNGISKSKKERYAMTPINLLLLVSGVLVGIG